MLTALEHIPPAQKHTCTRSVWDSQPHTCRIPQRAETGSAENPLGTEASSRTLTLGAEDTGQ